MAEDGRGKTNVSVGSVRVRGLAAPTRSGELKQAITSGLGEHLGADRAPARGPTRIELGNLKLRLPHGADAKTLADALGRAIRHATRRGQP